MVLCNIFTYKISFPRAGDFLDIKDLILGFAYNITNMKYLIPVWIWVHRFPNRIPEYMALVSIEPMTTDKLDSNGMPVVPKHKSFMVSLEWLKKHGLKDLPIDEAIWAKLPRVEVKNWLGCGVFK